MSSPRAEPTDAPRPRLAWLWERELPASLIAGALLLAWWAAVLADLAAPATPLAWGSLAIGMVYGGRAALQSLRSLRFDIDALMVVAAAVAAAVGHPQEGALLLFLFVLSGALEQRAVARTMRAVEALHKLMPTTAVVLRAGDWVESDPASLVPGDRIRIRTGELVPADARVAQGETTMDQATLTGESMPRHVKPGDEVYAGTINLHNPVEAAVLRPAHESSLQKVLNLVIEAQQQREPIQRLIDRFSEPYALGVMAVSTTVLLIWWLGFGVPFLGDGEHPGAAYTAITLLIVASPCALVIATPTATLASISRAARAGVLFKGGQAIERLANIGSVCFDKTGTLTFGRPRLHQVHPVAWSDGPELLAVAAALEAGSTHPIAVAVVEAARLRNVPAASVSEQRDIPGAGLSGVIDGRPARLGTYEHAEPLIPVCFRARVREVVDRIRARGQLAVVVSMAGGSGEGQAAVLILSDEVRPGARDLVDRLHGLSVRPVRMLTGDNRVTADQIAAELGIDNWDAELLPQDKVRIVEEMKRDRPPNRRSGVGFIGDGVNDAPALAAADVSIAIGSIGSDAALESADIVLLSDDLMTVPWAVSLARRTRAIVLFNLLFALGIILAMAMLTLIGSRRGFHVPLALGVVAHEGGTLLVVANSLRLLLARGAAPAHVENPPKRSSPAAPQVDPGVPEHVSGRPSSP